MSTYGPINLNNKRKDASQQTDINKRTRITLTALKKKIVTKSIDERRQTNLDIRVLK